MTTKTEFGLICSELLKDFQESKGGGNPYTCISRTQYQLARSAAKRIPHDLLKVDPDDERSFILAVGEYDCNRPAIVWLRPFHCPSRETHPAWDDGVSSHINENAANAVVRCLEGWIKWDGLQENLDNSIEPLSPAESLATTDNSKPANNPRSRLQIIGAAILIDGETFELIGGPKTRPRVGDFLAELIETQDYVTLTSHKLKTRDIENQAGAVKHLFDLDGPATAGYRIKSEWFQLAKNRPD